MIRKKHSKKETFAFIDSQNLNLGVKSQGWKLDFNKFIVFLKQKYRVKKAFLFLGFIPKNSKLYASLEEMDYILVFKPVLQANSYSKKAKVKGNVDAELVLHTMIQYENYKKAIVVSGDGDFFCLVEYLAKQNKLLHVFTPNKYYSRLFKPYSGFIVRIDQLRGSLEQKKTGISGRSKP